MRKETVEGINKVLQEIEILLWEYDLLKNPIPPNYPDEMIQPILKILMHYIADKIFKLGKDEGISIEDAGHMAIAAGNDLRELIKIYTGIDTHELYKS